MNLEKRFRIVVASSSKLFLDGICKVLEWGCDTKAVAESSDLKEIMRYLNQVKPEFLLLDNRSPNLDLEDLLSSIKGNGLYTKVILFADSIENKLNFPNLIYIRKETTSSELLEIMKNTNNGIPSKSHNHKDRTKCKVTKREIGVIDLIEKGLTNKEIADKLLIREKTVKAHLTNIFTKLGFQRRYQIIAHRRPVIARMK